MVMEHEQPAPAPLTRETEILRTCEIIAALSNGLALERQANHDQCEVIKTVTITTDGEEVWCHLMRCRRTGWCWLAPCSDAPASRFLPPAPHMREVTSNRIANMAG